MAASTDPSPNQEEGSNSLSVAETSGRSSLNHNPGIALDWTVEEQSLLEDGLTKYASKSSLIRYAKIALQLQDKTVRDVALRCRWMTKKENSKRRKDEHNLAKKNRDKKDRVTDPSLRTTARPNVLSYASTFIPDDGDGLSFLEIGGVTGQLLEQNDQVFNQISANFGSLKIQENINLLCQTRDNIFTILSTLNDIPGTARQMPALPVRLNDELAHIILPRMTLRHHNLSLFHPLVGRGDNTILM
ncbi:hypothetical protein GIB67_035524 [Kingdonia uniflora]|uniref:Myb-like domain-containing protein n=1 Tax=Kingdonia uniflora TaxID=39325 RepID=A0A7J7MC28_9MAGN|nr:hypothetical protein GIB67_035524 [Kingdonia uniflora]